MKLAGRLAVTVGAITFVVALLLPYSSRSQAGHSSTPSIWQISNREGVLLTLVALIAAALAVASAGRDAPVLVLLQSALGFYLLGNYFQIGLRDYSQTGAGFWLGTVAALMVAGGGALSIAAIWPKRGWRPTTGWGRRRRAAGDPAAPRR